MDSSIEILSPKGVWKEYDPNLPELETTLLKETVFEDYILSEYYFTGRQTEDGKSRIYAALARPVNEGKKFPAIIITGDFYQNIDFNELVGWAKGGYAALAVDYQGEAENKAKFTIYPKSIEYANIAKAGRHLDHCDTNARETCYYEWALCHRRAISFLQSLPFVAGENIGIMGIRNGGSFLWQVIATDNRLSAAAMVFTGWDEWKKEALDEERERWYAGVAPEAYAMFVQTPVLFMTATNDRVCNMDKVYNILARIPENVDTRLSLSPRLNNYIGFRQANTLKLWFKRNVKTKNDFLKPPIISSLLKDRKLYINTVADCSEEIKNVHIYYAYDSESPASRNWESVKTEETDQPEVFTSEIGILENCKNIVIFANILYKSGILISSNLISYTPDFEKLSPSVFRSRIVYNNQEGTSTFFSEQTNITVDYMRDDNPVKMIAGPGGIKGVTCTAGSLATYKIGDKRYIKGPDAIILCDISSAVPQEITVCIATDISSAQKLYKYKISLSAQNWQKIRLQSADFKYNGKSLDNFAAAGLIYFETTEPIAVNNIIFI